jgi:hypothetical protein
MEAPRAAGEEREMTDEELLGEATLAKIAPKPGVDLIDAELGEEGKEIEAIAAIEEIDEIGEIEEVVVDDAYVPDALAGDVEEFMEAESGEAVELDDVEDEQ